MKIINRLKIVRKLLIFMAVSTLYIASIGVFCVSSTCAVAVETNMADNCKNRQAQTESVNNIHDKKLIQVEHKAWVSYDKEKLYIACECKESFSEIKITGLKHDGAVWAGDSVEIMISLPDAINGSPFYHFAINPRNVKWDSIDQGPRKPLNSKYSPKWESGAHIEKNIFWTVEMAIPWKEIGVRNPEKELIIQANICRARSMFAEKGLSKGTEYSSWSLMFSSFQEHDLFGKWILD